MPILGWFYEPVNKVSSSRWLLYQNGHNHNFACFSFFADANEKEILTLKVFSPDDRPSDEQLKAMLKKADLESRGYKKELTTKLVSGQGSDKSDYQKANLYYKIVNCSRLQEITQELETLMPGRHRVLPWKILSLASFKKYKKEKRSHSADWVRAHNIIECNWAHEYDTIQQLCLSKMNVLSFTTRVVVY